LEPLEEEIFALLSSGYKYGTSVVPEVHCHSNKVCCNTSVQVQKLFICHFLNPDMPNSAQMGLGSFSIKIKLKTSGCIVIRYFL